MDLRDLIFRMRGFTPVPFLLVSVIWANPMLETVLIGAVLCFCGELLRISALRHAGGATRTRNVGAPQLVTSGPYAHVRNPLYLANMMLYTGFAIASGAFLFYLPAITFIYFAWQYAMIISLEEGALKKLFGDSYLEFCKIVPRLFPRLSSAYPVIDKAPYSLSSALREERSTLLGLFVTWSILAVRVFAIPALP